MWRKIALFVASIPLFGSAMTSADAAPARQCRVLAAEKLGPGTAAAICAEVERAMDAVIPGARYQIDVRIISPARLSATGSVDGRKFPEQNLASSDRNLTPGAIQRFARALGEAVRAAR